MATSAEDEALSPDLSSHPLAVHLTSLHAAAEYYERAAREATSRLGGLSLRAELAEETASRERALRTGLERELDTLRKRHTPKGLEESASLQLTRQSLLVPTLESDLAELHSSLESIRARLARTQQELELERIEHRKVRRRAEGIGRLEEVVGEYAKLVRKLEGELRARADGQPAVQEGEEDAKGTWLSSGWRSWASSPLASPATSVVSLGRVGDGSDHRDEVSTLQARLAEKQREVEAVEAVAEGLADELGRMKAAMAKNEADESTAVKMVHHYISHASSSQSLLHARLQSVQSTNTTLTASLSLSQDRSSNTSSLLRQTSSELAKQSVLRRAEAVARGNAVVREERIAKWVQEVVRRIGLLASCRRSIDEDTQMGRWEALARQVADDGETLGLLPCTPSSSRQQDAQGEGGKTALQEVAEDPMMARMLAHEDLVLSLLEEVEARDRPPEDTDGREEQARTSGSGSTNTGVQDDLDGKALETPPRPSIPLREGPFQPLQTALARLSLSLDALRSNVAFTAALSTSSSPSSTSTSTSPAHDLLFLTALLTRQISRLRDDVDSASVEADRAATATSAFAVLLDSPRPAGADSVSQSGPASHGSDSLRHAFEKRFDALEKDVSALRTVARQVGKSAEVPTPLLPADDARPTPPTPSAAEGPGESSLKAFWSALPAALTASPPRPRSPVLFGESVAMATATATGREDAFAGLELDSIPDWRDLVPRPPNGATTTTTGARSASAGQKVVRKMASSPAMHHVGLTSITAPSGPKLANLRRQRHGIGGGGSRGSRDWRLGRVSLEVE